MRLIRLFWFHFRLYATNTYFLWVTVTGTATLFLLQYLTAYATHNLNDPTIWVRSGIFGLWSSATTAAGSISFQRYQGTLPYLINSRVDDRLSLLALLLPAASFGLLAFPFAYLLAVILHVNHQNLTPYLLLVIIVLWFAAVIMDLLIAALFVLTRNGMVYEKLITLPLLLLAGLFGNLSVLQKVSAVSRWLLPIATPISSLLTGMPLDWTTAAVSMLIWFTVTLWLTHRLLQHARQHGLMGVM